MENNIVQLIMPMNLCIAGFSHSGKTSIVLKLIKNRTMMFDKPISKILYCYGIWNASYSSLEADEDVTFLEGLPSEKNVNELPQMSIIVFDDMMQEVVQSKYIETLFSRGGHHLSIGLIYVSQNLYQQGPYARSINLNLHYLFLTNNPRDYQQISCLGRQLGIGAKLLEVYKEIMQIPFSHLVINLSPYTEIKYKLLSDIFNKERIIAFDV